MTTRLSSTPPDEDTEAPSKTRRKNDAHALQQLGAELVALHRERVVQLELPEALLDAVLEAQRTRSHEGKRRQLQYIGKLMRGVDPAPIRLRLDEWKAVPAAQVALMHRIERWRERLLAEPGALNELADAYPQADLQQLRTLIRNVERERSQNKPPRNYRALFPVAARYNFGMNPDDELLIGLVSISDRASQGVYEDQGIPALKDWFTLALSSPWRMVTRLIPDERPRIEATLKELVDQERCHLVLTTGGTGPALRDVTPEATLAVADKEMPGFGEQMRQVSLRFVPTAILSRQVAVIRKQSLIINLPGQPKAIRETLEGLKDEGGKPIVNGIFAAVPYCIDLIGGPYIETHDAVVKAFRPKSAIRKKQP